MIRIAATSGQKLHSWSTDNWPHLQLWNRDLDLSAPAWMVDELAAGTATETATAHGTLLRSLEGSLHPELDRSGVARFIRPIGVYHRTRRGFGQWYCPRCLGDDGLPYFRKRWRLVGFACCTRHGVLLHDRCPRCEAPIVPHRGSLAVCHVCATRLDTADCRPADAAALQLQHHAQLVLGGAPVTLTGLLGLHPVLFFALINRLLTLLVIGPRRGNLQAVVGSLLARPLSPTIEVERLELRFLDPPATHDALRGVDLMLRGWPDMFIGLMMEARLWWSWATRDADIKTLPFIYVEPVRRYLYNSSGS